MLPSMFRFAKQYRFRLSSEALEGIKAMAYIEQKQRRPTLVYYGDGYALQNATPALPYTPNISTALNTIPMLTDYKPQEWLDNRPPSYRVHDASLLAQGKPLQFNNEYIQLHRQWLLTDSTIKFYHQLYLHFHMEKTTKGHSMPAMVGTALEAIGLRLVIPPPYAPYLWAIDVRDKSPIPNSNIELADERAPNPFNPVPTNPYPDPID